MGWEEIRTAAAKIMPVGGGHTAAQRGIVELSDGSSVFVKLAVDDQTTSWLQQELTAYHWLEAHRYRYAPKLIAEGPDGFALPDLADWDWSDQWTQSKLAAIFQATDALADLSATAASDIDSANFGDNPWIKAPRLIEPYAQNMNLDNEWRERLEGLLRDTKALSTYEALAATEPWRGAQLVHYDVRADNLGYDATTGIGLLVDWNWLSLGSVKLDRTVLLVNVYKSGFADLVAAESQRLDEASLAWFIGFCLKNAASPTEGDRLRDLRFHQLHSALVAHEMIQNLMNKEI